MFRFPSARCYFRQLANGFAPTGEAQLYLALQSCAYGLRVMHEFQITYLALFISQLYCELTTWVLVVYLFCVNVKVRWRARLSAGCQTTVCSSKDRQAATCCGQGSCALRCSSTYQTAVFQFPVNLLNRLPSGHGGVLK